MSYHIASIICDFTGDFESVREYGESLQTAWKRDEVIRDAQYKVANLISRFGLEPEFGEFQVKDLSVENSPKEVTLKVTRFISKYCLEYYTAWEDTGSASNSRGYIKLEVLTPLPSGQFWSLYRSKLGTETFYAKKAPGMVRVEDFETYGNRFRGGTLTGIGTGLMQVAAEVSQQRGFGINVFLDAAYNSPGFYRKAHMTTRSPRDEAIDKELEQAKKENRKPKTNEYGGNMYLEDEGRAFYAKKIAEKPILNQSVIYPTHKLHLLE